MGEIADWQGHALEQIAALKDHLERPAAEGVEAIGQPEGRLLAVAAAAGATGRNGRFSDGSNGPQREVAGGGRVEVKTLYLAHSNPGCRQRVVKSGRGEIRLVEPSGAVRQSKPRHEPQATDGRLCQACRDRPHALRPA